MAPKTKPAEGEKKKRKNGPRGWFGMNAGLRAEIEAFQAQYSALTGLDVPFAEACRLLVIDGLRVRGIGVGVTL